MIFYAKNLLFSKLFEVTKSEISSQPLLGSLWNFRLKLIRHQLERTKAAHVLLEATVVVDFVVGVFDIVVNVVVVALLVVSDDIVFSCGQLSYSEAPKGCWICCCFDPVCC